MAQTNETVRDSSFVIADDVQDYYEGSYKNGEPYKGYFKVGDNEIYQINFYDKGKLIYQYSYDFLKYLQHTEDEAYSYNDKVLMDVKTSYKNGKVFNGRSYQEIKDGLLIKRWKNGELDGLLLDVFAKHYYNRMRFILKGDTLHISDFQEKDMHASIYFKEERVHAEVFKKDTVLMHQQFMSPNIALWPPKSSIMCMTLNGEARCTVVQNGGVTFQVPNLYTAFLQVVGAIEATNVTEIVTVLAQEMGNEEGLKRLFDGRGERQFIGFAETNAAGVIAKGILWSEENDKETYRIFRNGDVIENKTATLAEFQKIAKDYFSTLEEE